jgi:hypothetical protein
MTFWGIAVVVVALAAALWMARGGKAGRAARRELRQLRKQDGAAVDVSAIADQRRRTRATLSHRPGKSSPS